MAKVVFIQLNEYELHGLESLAGELKRSGHQVNLIIPFFEKTPLRKIMEFTPDLVGFPVASAEREEALAWAKAIKARIRTLIIFGGVDPTFFPEIIADESVDLVLRGEAEQSLVKLAEALDRKEDYCAIPNLWAKKEGKIFRNPVGPLMENLEALSFPDKAIYFSRYPYFRKYPIKFFIASRGCPFGCSYCANQGLRELYPNRNFYLRFKSPEYLLEEIKAIISRYPGRTLGFNDDLFSYDRKWLEQFLPGYRKQVGIPFFCTGRIDLMTEETARLLKEGGCYSLFYGLESADADDRGRILNRKMSDPEIEKGVEILRKHGIAVQSYNMFNYPGDTVEKGLKTLDYNCRLKNDFVVSSLFQPFPGTSLARQLEQEGRLKHPGQENGSRLSYFAFSPLRQKDTEKLENLHKLFLLGFHFRLMQKLLALLVRLPKNPLFDILFLLSFAIDYGRVHRLKWRETVRYNAIHIRTTYLRRRAREPRK